MALQDYKDEAKATLRSIYNDALLDAIPQISRLRVLYQDDATLKADGNTTIDAYDASYDGYADDIQAASDEAGVDAVMGSVSIP